VIFADTSFWVAASAVRDDHHDEAIELLRSTAGQTLVISNHVRGESWTLMNRRYGHAKAVALLERFEQTTRLRLEFVPRELERDALDWLRRRDEREYSFVDATSFALMRRLAIREALAFDGDFEATGFVVLRA
jgi:predicted nucleic acid-binding protein